MIKENLNALIMEAIKRGNNTKKEALRAVKTAIMNWETSKDNVGKTLTESDEINILRKLVAQYEDTAAQCNDGKHDTLVKEATDMANVIKEYLPQPVTEETIRNFIDGHFDSDFLVKKNMGNIIKTIKGFYPAADGKMTSQIVASYLH